MLRIDSVELVTCDDAIDYALRLYHKGIVTRVDCVDQHGTTFYTAKRNQFDYAGRL
jgi:hypothetical protein